MRWLRAVRIVWTNGSVALALLGWGAAALVARPVARRFRVDRLLLFLALAATVLIVAATWPLDSRYALSHAVDSFRPGQILSWWRHGWNLVSRRGLHTVDAALNILLFVPAGLLWTMLVGRPVRVWVGLAGLSFVAESIQAVSGFRSADPRDLVTNSVGAAVGVTLAVLLVRGRAAIAPRGSESVSAGSADTADHSSRGA